MKKEPWKTVIKDNEMSGLSVAQSSGRSSWKFTDMEVAGLATFITSALNVIKINVMEFSVVTGRIVWILALRVLSRLYGVHHVTDVRFVVHDSMPFYRQVAAHLLQLSLAQRLSLKYFFPLQSTDCGTYLWYSCIAPGVPASTAGHCPPMREMRPRELLLLSDRTSPPT